MSWKCSGKTNHELINNLWAYNLLKTDRVRQAFEKVDRAHFTFSDPYIDTPQRIGFDATISAPHMHAKAAEGLADFLKPGCKALDVGSGSGYLTAVFAHLVSSDGQAVGIEHIPQLCELSLRNLRKDSVHAEMLANRQVKIVQGDGRLGYPQAGPYDAIHVGAAAAATIPQQLIDQLKAPGRMFIPVEENYSQHIWQVDKDRDGNVSKKKTYGVMYVPLTDTKVYVG